MMKTKDLSLAIREGKLDPSFAELYAPETLPAQRERFLRAIAAFEALYGEDREVALFSVAGRSEISGNHTDHNHGKVIAASIDLDIIAVAARNDAPVIRVKSEGHAADTVDLSAPLIPDPTAYGRSSAIIAGVCAGFAQRGFAIGGFDAYTTSNVLKGSGLSSSAAFEDAIGTILNHFYNDGRISEVDISILSQYAENEFFGKPCGLMDQVACAVGGMVSIDFADPKAPIIQKLGFDITEAGYCLCIVNTGGNHADLTDDYAAVPAEMKAVARALDRDVLRESDKEALLAAIPTLRQTLGDRAILRALHFYNENERVAAQIEALEESDLDRFFSLVKESGRSSFCYLQNVYTTKNVAEQGLSLALALAEDILKDKRAAWRVHGGGFAGTIQAFVPVDSAEAFRTRMDAAFGKEACLVLHIRPRGAIKLFE